MNDRQIITGVRQGDPSAINRAIEQYSKLLWKTVSAVLYDIASKEDIEECVADVFVFLWQKHEQFDDERGSLKTWLCLLAKSKALDRFRQHAKSKEIELNDDLPLMKNDILDGVITAETGRALMAAINSLSEPDREIIIRRYYYSQKPSEIGRALSLPVRQIENRLYRSKQRLRYMLTAE